MKKITFLPIVLLVSAFAITTLISAQTASTKSAGTKAVSTVKSTPVIDDSFTARYYSIKAANPTSASLYGNYAAAASAKVRSKKAAERAALDKKLAPKAAQKKD